MDHSPGEYLVISPATQGRYQVHYHGEGHELNACSCMDYRTSHLEAVKIWISDKKSRKIHQPDRTLTTLYVDYSQEPCVKVRYGMEDKTKLKPIFDPLINDGSFNHLTELRLPDAIREAFQASPFFRCRQDVLEYADRIQDKTDNAARLHFIDQVQKTICAFLISPSAGCLD